jgi:hypothetical protein
LQFPSFALVALLFACCHVLLKLALVDSLCVVGWSAADVKKAKEGGFNTVQSLIMNPRKV